MPGASANGCFVRGVGGVVVFGLFERVYSSVEVTGTGTELKGSKTISLEGERESDDVFFVKLLPRWQHKAQPRVLLIIYYHLARE